MSLSALWNGGVETEVTELRSHIAISGAGLVGGSSEFKVSFIKYLLGYIAVRRLGSRGPSSVKGMLDVLRCSGKGARTELAR